MLYNGTAYTTLCWHVEDAYRELRTDWRLHSKHGLILIALSILCKSSASKRGLKNSSHSLISVQIDPSSLRWLISETAVCVTRRDTSRLSCSVTLSYSDALSVHTVVDHQYGGAWPASNVNARQSLVHRTSSNSCLRLRVTRPGPLIGILPTFIFRLILPMASPTKIIAIRRVRIHVRTTDSLSRVFRTCTFQLRKSPERFVAITKKHS